ncbi:hypothetical protein ARMSODRAFT_959676 [Armillaria solidipes]|uniref:Uncharacterized protein n=1 Tax=Armillaria solidipes TaxID=1076256 RepID=A0A2H3BIY6_9AGAR|nr:hypothetical protein ARMSODRAFT_959676 [Armillaria solidipes]
MTRSILLTALLQLLQKKTRILVLAPVGTFARTSLNACVCIEPGHGSTSLACKNYRLFHGPPMTLADTRFEEAVRRCYFRTSIQTLNKAKPGRTFSIKTVLNSRGIGSEALPFDKCCPRPVQL